MSTKSAVSGAPAEVAGYTQGSSDVYDILVLDASIKAGLASVRSLARAGLRVAAAESIAQFDPGLPVPAFRSRYCARAVTLPDLIDDKQAFVDALLDFVREHSVRVVLPSGDITIGVLRPYRPHLAELGCFLALAPEGALEIANDKDRTLAVAERLGIAQPRTVRVGSTGELKAAVAELGFPLVIKPTISWAGQVWERLVPVDVIDMDEATEATERILDAGAGVLAQEWAPGRREGATLFVLGDEVLAACGHVAHRTSPPLGGVSVLRESIEVPADTLDAAVRLVKEIGLQGVCEVEFRRDAAGRPLLMEVNARLAGTIENAVRAGVDFPLMIWRWATGLDIAPVTGYRCGVRTRWLHGDLRWLWQNWARTGRPDAVSHARGLYAFIAEFTRTFHYDYFDARDIRPFLSEIRYTSRVLLKSRAGR
ncbi:MAG TPA: ATP-grasp domain-containing protein [Trebonia sp.]|nr:ATP-grasp domain-containing protein [Trebonia sp.]